MSRHDQATHHVSVRWLSGLPHVVLQVLPARAGRESSDDDAVFRLLEARCQKQKSRRFKGF